MERITLELAQEPSERREEHITRIAAAQLLQREQEDWDYATQIVRGQE